MNRIADILVRFESLDRRWIYLVMALAVTGALLSGLYFPDRPSDVVRPVYEHIEALPSGAPILLSLDYSPSSAPELEPMAEALTRHALLKGQPLCFISLWPTGNNMIARVVSRICTEEFPDAVEGRDWVRLGFQAGGEMLVNSLRDSLSARYELDMGGTPLSDLPALASVQGLGDFGLILSLSAGQPGLKEWILYAGDVLDVPVAGGCTGVGAPQFFPYYPLQLVGLLGALKGAAEYEAALAEGYPDDMPPVMRATRGMGPQAVAHAVIVAFILLGNLAILVARRREVGR